MEPEQNGFGSVLAANKDPLLDTAQDDLFEGGAILARSRQDTGTSPTLFLIET